MEEKLKKLNKLHDFKSLGYKYINNTLGEFDDEIEKLTFICKLNKIYQDMNHLIGMIQFITSITDIDITENLPMSTSKRIIQEYIKNNTYDKMELDCE